MADSLRLPWLFWRRWLAGPAPAPRTNLELLGFIPLFVPFRRSRTAASAFSGTELGEKRLPALRPIRYNRTRPPQVAE